MKSFLPALSLTLLLTATAHAGFNGPSDARAVTTNVQEAVQADEMTTCVLVGRKAILTDLAKDYAKRHGIELKREDACASGKGA